MTCQESVQIIAVHLRSRYASTFSRSSQPVDLGLPLDKKLSVYALAAGAAGVCTLALAPPADAKIIYTKTNTPILVNKPYYLDVNHDGTPDFTISLGAGGYFVISWVDVGVQGSQITKGFYNSVVTTKPGFGFEADLPPNVPVWKNRNFGALRHAMAECTLIHNKSSYQTHSVGPWRNVESRYLGLKFSISGQTHYGWARLNVKLDKKCKFTVTLTGYAYETVPNKLILTGHTKGPSGEIVPSGLGHLAGGASAMSDWRVKRVAAPVRDLPVRKES